MLHIFDLDHTLFVKNASVAFGAYLYRNKEFSFFKMITLLSLYTLHKCKLISLNQLHRIIFYKLFWNQCASHYYDEVQKFLDQEMDNLLDKVIFERLNKAQGIKALLSSSPDFLVKAIAKRLNIDCSMGSTYNVQEDKFSHLSHVVNGKDKAQRACELSNRFHVPLNEITAYSDSFLDIPLLEIVGFPIAVNPDDTLRKESLKKNWQMIITKAN